MGATAGPAHAHGRTGETLACRYVCCVLDFPSGCRTSAVGSHGSPQSGVVRLVSCISGVLKTLESQMVVVASVGIHHLAPESCNTRRTTWLLYPRRRRATQFMLRIEAATKEGDRSSVHA